MSVEDVDRWIPFIPHKGPQAPSFATNAVATGVDEAKGSLDDIFAPGGPLDVMANDATRPRTGPNESLAPALFSAASDLSGAGQYKVAPTQQIALDPAMLDHARNILAARRAATAQANTDLNGVRNTVNGGGPSAAAIQQTMALSAAHRAAGAQMGAARGGNMVMAANNAGAPQALQGVTQGGMARAGELSQARGSLLNGSTANTAAGIQTDQGATDLSRLQNTVQLGNTAAAGMDAATASDVFRSGTDTAGRALSTLGAGARDWAQGETTKLNAEDDAKAQYQAYLDSLFGSLQSLPTMAAGGSIAKAQAGADAQNQILGAGTKAAGSIITAAI